MVPLFVFWMMFLLDLELDFVGGLLVFRWELVVLLLLQICVFFVMRGGFMKSLSWEGRAGIVGAFNLASGYLDGLLDIDSVCYGRVVGRMCLAGLRLGGAGSSGVFDGRDGFDFDVVGFPFLGGGVPRRASCGMCISRFGRASSNFGEFNCRNKALTARLLGRGCRCFGLRRAFSKFYRRRSTLVEIYGVGLKTSATGYIRAGVLR